MKRVIDEVVFYFKVSKKAGWGRNKAGNPIPVFMKYKISSEEPLKLKKRKGQITETVKRNLAKEMKINKRYLIRISDRKGYKVLGE